MPPRGAIRQRNRPNAPRGGRLATTDWTTHVACVHGRTRAAPVAAAADPDADTADTPAAAIVATWAPDAEKELRKIPFFVRGKARRNTERYALDRSVPVITVETLYDAKAHFSR